MSKSIEKWPSKCFPSSARFETLYLQNMRLLHDQNCKDQIHIYVVSCSAHMHLPNKKWSGELIQISWTYITKVAGSNHIRRLTTIQHLPYDNKVLLFTQVTEHCLSDTINGLNTASLHSNNQPNLVHYTVSRETWGLGMRLHITIQ